MAFALLRRSGGKPHLDDVRLLDGVDALVCGVGDSELSPLGAANSPVAAINRTKKALGFFAIIVACIWSAGHPQHAYYCSLSIAGFAIWRLAAFKVSWTNRFKGLTKVILAAALGLIVVAPQLAASWELAQHGVRGQTSIQNLLTNSIPWRHLITLIVPEFYGNARAYWGAGNFPEYTGYVGAAGLVLAVMAFFHKRFNWRSEIVFCAVYALTALHLAYGGWLNAPLSYLPGYTSFRGVQRFLGIWGLAAAGLAAFGVEAVILAKRKRRIVIMSLLTMLFMLAGVAFIKTQGVVFRMAQLFSCEMPLQRFEWICNTLKFPLAVLFLLSATLIILQFLNIRVVTAHKQYVYLSVVVCLGILIGVDLIYFSRNYLPRGQIGKGFQTTPGIEGLQTENQGRLVRFENQSIIGSPLTPNTGIMYGLEDTIGYDSLTLDRYNRLFGVIEPERYGAFAHHALGSFRRIESLDSPVLDMIGGERLILEHPLATASKVRYLKKHGWDRLYTGDDLTIYRNREALPLAWIVGQTRVHANDQDQLSFLQKPSFNPAKIAVLSKPSPIPLDASARGEIVITHRSLNSLTMRVNVHADSGKGGLIVLRQNHYPGWQAWIDGGETALIRANYSFQAIAAPVGEHVVQLKYQPTHFNSLVIVSILSLFIVGAFILTREKDQAPR